MGIEQVEKAINDSVSNIKAFQVKADTQFQELHSQTGELSDRIKNIEQVVAGGPAIAPRTSSKGLGALVTGSDAYTQFLERKTARAKLPLSSLNLELKNTITQDAGSPAEPTSLFTDPTRLADIVHAPERALRIRDLLPVLPTASNMIEFTRESAFTNNAAAQTAEGATKAESDILFEDGQANVITLAHFLKVSRQALADAPLLQRHLDQRMRYGVLLKEDTQILNGDGTNNSMSGLLDSGNFTAYAYAETGDTKTDTIRKSIEQLEVSDYQASGIVLNPRDWSAITREKDSEGRYLFAKPQEATPAQLWGLPVVATNSIAQGTFLVADFLKAAILWDRQQAIVEMFEQDEDNVKKNLVTVRAEERLALTVLLPGAIVSGDFA